MNVSDSSKEIKIKYDNLDQAVADLEDLADAVSARSLSLTFSDSRGEVPEKMEKIAEELRLVGADFAEIVKKTAAWMNNVNKGFKEAEQQASEHYTK